MGDDIGAQVRAVDGLPELIAELIGATGSFCSIEENDKAMEWALRAYRAGRQSIAADLRRDIELQSGWLWFTYGESMLLAVAKWIEGEATAATPDGPRRWALPDEPGPKVTAVRDEGGRLWRRHAGLWCHLNQYLGHSHRAWSIVVFDHGPLTDATPAADGQDGDGR